MTNRQEVAQKLRKVGEIADNEYDSSDEAFCVIDDIIGTDNSHYYKDSFDRLADLIDPTCTMSCGYDNCNDSTAMYLELIACSPEDTVACCCHSCGDVFRYERGIVPNYCPNCGARVLQDTKEDFHE